MGYGIARICSLLFFELGQFYYTVILKSVNYKIQEMNNFTDLK